MISRTEVLELAKLFGLRANVRVPVPTFTDIVNHMKRGELDSEWTNMLAHQLQTLPPLAQFWEELPLLTLPHFTGQRPSPAFPDK